MNKIILLPIFLFAGILTKAQQVDSIYFHLYTDSLKKGQHNYINVDGKLSNGSWLPLTAKQILFTSSEGTFNGNELFIPDHFKPEKVTVKAVLRSNPAIWKEITIWIKQLPDPFLPNRNDMDNAPRRNRKNN
ncbi:MAG: hypothetical protein JNJ86_04325 [Chitinophagaceae bacterium]|jgi:hypothetical protein|nr:hypothetical protein [Chitinophagaceae bacterium]